jgi:zinc protease
MPHLPRLEIPIERVRLSNGLRVVVLPDHSSPVVAVSVLYDVGYRSEPEGRSGFAHLFEHMMFQGSRRVPKGEFDRLVLGNGGVVNGVTTPDFTAYFEVVPSPALELALFLEGDRMRSLLLNRENLDNQRAVVEEEIRLNVLNRPYGRYPWILLPALMFDTYPNAHDGYGSFEDLRAAGLEDVRKFFTRFYTPANAVVSICGDVDPGEAVDMVARHLGDVPGGRVPRRKPFGEPVRSGVRRSRHEDPLAPTPALALGYRVPDPIAHLEEVLALDVFGRVLTDGVASRLERRLVAREGLATSVDAWVGEFPGWAGPLDERDPTRFQISVFYPRVGDEGRIVAAIDDEIAPAVTGDEVERVVSRVVATYARRADHVLNRSLAAARFELLHGDPGLLGRVPGLYAGIDADMVSRLAADWVRSDTRSELLLVPGGAA